MKEVVLAAVAGLDVVEGAMISAAVGELAVHHKVLDAEPRLPSRLLDRVLSLMDQGVVVGVSALEVEVDSTWLISDASQRSVACILWFFVVVIEILRRA